MFQFENLMLYKKFCTIARGGVNYNQLASKAGSEHLGKSWMNKLVKILVVFVVSSFILKGVIFRMCVKYKAIGERPIISITSQNLKARVESSTSMKSMDLKKIVDLAGRITLNELSFSSKKKSQNPNDLINSKEADCVGYAALFNSVANYLILKHQLQDEIIATHKIGQLNLFGVDVHPYINDPFFKDHDYNEIKNIKTGEVILIDPSLRDYTGVKWVVEKN